MRISTDNPDLSLEFGEMYTRFHAYVDTIETRGIEAKIKQVLDKRKRFRNAYGFMLGMIIFFCGLVLDFCTL